jgi:cbb3-type cytochrome oxidase subunit 3
MIIKIINFIADNAAIIALLFFFIIFCGVVIMLLCNNKKQYQDYAQIPLKEDDEIK